MDLWLNSGSSIADLRFSTHLARSEEEIILKCMVDGGKPVPCALCPEPRPEPCSQEFDWWEMNWDQEWVQCWCKWNLNSTHSSGSEVWPLFSLVGWVYIVESVLRESKDRNCHNIRKKKLEEFSLWLTLALLIRRATPMDHVWKHLVLQTRVLNVL